MSDGIATGTVVNGEKGVVVTHARFSVYCVKSDALNVLITLLTSEWTTQISKETSTATHVDSCKHRFIQSDSDVYGYKFPPSEATPSSLDHSSHSVKQD